MDASITALPAPGKDCPGCATYKEAREYHRCRTTATGLQVYCKACRRVRNTREDYREKVRVRARRLSPVLNAKRRANRGRKDRENERYRARLASDPVFAARRRAIRRESYKRNPAKFKHEAVLRMERVVRATPKWADLDMIRAFYADAQAWGEELGIPMHVDHVVPLRGKEVCGLHVEYNLRIVEKTVNLSKGSKLEIELLEAA